MFLKQSTAQTVRFGPFLDSTDGITSETGLTIAQADMQLSKDGGAFAQKNASGNATHDADGWYSTSLNATDTATVGELLLQVTVSGALPVWTRWFVVEEAIYDALFAASATGFDSNGRVDVGEWLGNAVTASGGTPDVNIQSSDDIDLTATQKTSVNTEVDTALTDIHLDHLFAADYDPASKPGVATALLNELVESDGGVSRFTTNALEQVWSAATRILTASTNFNDLSTADVDARLVAIGLDHLLSAAVTGTDITDDSIIAQLVSASATADWDDFVNTTDSLQAIRDRGDTSWITGNTTTPPTAAAIADAVWDESTTGHTTSGTFGEQVKTDVDAILADTNELQGDWANGGRLDVILDARASQTTADAIETDTQDIQGRLPAALVSGRMSSDAVSISGSTTAADRLEASVLTIVSGTAQTGTLSTTVMTSDLSEATDDHYNGRIIIWTSGVLQNQATDITDYSGTNGTLTYTAVTEAPSNGDTFIII